MTEVLRREDRGAGREIRLIRDTRTHWAVECSRCGMYRDCADDGTSDLGPLEAIELADAHGSDECEELQLQVRTEGLMARYEDDLMRGAK